ncbi:hydrolase, alpha/beta domain protein [Ostertagia ostertagi]
MAATGNEQQPAAGGSYIIVQKYRALAKHKKIMTRKQLRLQNKQVFYSVMGEGKPVVLVHGFAEDSDVWRNQLAALAQNHLLIIPDLPGSGGSELQEDMSIEGMAECVKNILDYELPNQKEENSIIMIGHSMGGYITLAFAEKYAGRLQGFGLFHSSAFADSEEKKTARRKSIEFIQTHGSYEFIKQSAPNLFTEDYRIKNGDKVADMIARYSNFDQRALVAYYEAMIQRPDRTAVLKSFGKPILFLIGKNDKAIPFEDSMKQCHIPQLATVEILAASAHMGMWEEKEKSNQALLSFLQQIQQFTLH